MLWLFVALSVATAAALLYFGSIAPGPAKPRIYTALVGNLALPVIAWYVYKNLKRHQPPAKPHRDAVGPPPP